MKISCQNDIEYYIENDPQTLLEEIQNNNMPYYILTYALEEIGVFRNPIVSNILYQSLMHSDSVVREGALYGIAGQEPTQRILDKLSEMSDLDPSATIRGIAAEMREEMLGEP